MVAFIQQHVFDCISGHNARVVNKYIKGILLDEFCVFKTIAKMLILH